MNDFTKEDLEDMRTWGECFTEFGNSGVDKFQRHILDKIQSMIDNYCEHEWNNPCCGCPASSRYCTKCEKKIYTRGARGEGII